MSARQSDWESLLPVRLRIAAGALVAVVLVGCGTPSSSHHGRKSPEQSVPKRSSNGSPQPSSSPTPTARASGAVHVMVVMEENQGYGATIGSCGADPYICSLATGYASASSWTGVTHPSQPNYVAIDSGSTQGCNSDGCVGAGAYSATDLGGQLTSAGIPWVGWMESMPSACYQGDSYGNYVLKHNPFIQFKDNLSPAPCRILPYPGVATMVSTLTGANAPDFAWITPNLNDDMHDGTVAQGDAWLKTNLQPVLTSSWFLDFNSTVIITMDENSGDNTGGGGHVPMVVISSKAKGRGNVVMTGNHYGTLRSIEEAYGLPLLGAAASPANGDLSSLFG